MRHASLLSFLLMVVSLTGCEKSQVTAILVLSGLIGLGGFFVLLLVRRDRALQKKWNAAANAVGVSPAGRKGSERRFVGEHRGGTVKVTATDDRLRVVIAFAKPGPDESQTLCLVHTKGDPRMLKLARAIMRFASWLDDDEGPSEIPSGFDAPELELPASPLTKAAVVLTGEAERWRPALEDSTIAEAVVAALSRSGAKGLAIVQMARRADRIGVIAAGRTDHETLGPMVTLCKLLADATQG